jgi:murein DD-endopeptidase MepM/ murein hydrolase activator NlpD
MSKIEAAVGDRVTRGQLIGYIGSTGRSTGPHLHYELRLNDKSINPRHVLPPESPDLNVK